VGLDFGGGDGAVADQVAQWIDDCDKANARHFELDGARSRDIPVPWAHTRTFALVRPPAVDGARLAGMVTRRSAFVTEYQDPVFPVRSIAVIGGTVAPDFGTAMRLLGFDVTVYSPSTISGLAQVGDPAFPQGGFTVEAGGHFDVIGSLTRTQVDIVTRELTEAQRLAWRYAGGPAVTDAPIALSNRVSTLDLIGRAYVEVRDRLTSRPDVLDLVQLTGMARVHERPDVVVRAVVGVLRAESRLDGVQRVADLVRDGSGRARVADVPLHVRRMYTVVGPHETDRIMSGDSGRVGGVLSRPVRFGAGLALRSDADGSLPPRLHISVDASRDPAPTVQVVTWGVQLAEIVADRAQQGGLHPAPVVQVGGSDLGRAASVRHGLRAVVADQLSRVGVAVDEAARVTGAMFGDQRYTGQTAESGVVIDVREAPLPQVAGFGHSAVATPLPAGAETGQVSLALFRKATREVISGSASLPSDLVDQPWEANRVRAQVGRVHHPVSGQWDLLEAAVREHGNNVLSAELAGLIAVQAVEDARPPLVHTLPESALTEAVQVAQADSSAASIAGLAAIVHPGGIVASKTGAASPSTERVPLLNAVLAEIAPVDTWARVRSLAALVVAVGWPAPGSSADFGSSGHGGSSAGAWQALLALRMPDGSVEHVAVVATKVGVRWVGPWGDGPHRAGDVPAQVRDAVDAWAVVIDADGRVQPTYDAKWATSGTAEAISPANVIETELGGGLLGVINDLVAAENSAGGQLVAARDFGHEIGQHYVASRPDAIGTWRHNTIVELTTLLHARVATALLAQANPDRTATPAVMLLARQPVTGLPETAGAAVQDFLAQHNDVIRGRLDNSIRRIAPGLEDELRAERDLPGGAPIDLWTMPILHAGTHSSITTADALITDLLQPDPAQPPLDARTFYPDNLSLPFTLSILSRDPFHDQPAPLPALVDDTNDGNDRSAGPARVPAFDDARYEPADETGGRKPPALPPANFSGTPPRLRPDPLPNRYRTGDVDLTFAGTLVAEARRVVGAVNPTTTDDLSFGACVALVGEFVRTWFDSKRLHSHTTGGRSSGDVRQNSVLPLAPSDDSAAEVGGVLGATARLVAGPGWFTTSLEQVARLAGEARAGSVFVVLAVRNGVDRDGRPQPGHALALLSTRGELNGDGEASWPAAVWVDPSRPSGDRVFDAALNDQASRRWSDRNFLPLAAVVAAYVLQIGPDGQVVPPESVATEQARIPQAVQALLDPPLSHKFAGYGSEEETQAEVTSDSETDLRQLGNQPIVYRDGVKGVLEKAPSGKWVIELVLGPEATSGDELAGTTETRYFDGESIEEGAAELRSILNGAPPEGEYLENLVAGHRFQISRAAIAARVRIHRNRGDDSSVHHSVGVHMSGIYEIMELALANFKRNTSKIGQHLEDALAFGDAIALRYLEHVTEEQFDALGFTIEDVFSKPRSWENPARWVLDFLYHDIEVQSARSLMAITYAMAGGVAIDLDRYYPNIGAIAKNWAVVVSRIDLDALLFAAPKRIQEFFYHEREDIVRWFDRFVRTRHPAASRNPSEVRFRADGSPASVKTYIMNVLTPIPLQFVRQYSIGVRTSFPQLADNKVVLELRLYGDARVNEEARLADKATIIDESKSINERVRQSLSPVVADSVIPLRQALRMLLRDGSHAAVHATVNSLRAARSLDLDDWIAHRADDYHISNGAAAIIAAANALHNPQHLHTLSLLMNSLHNSLRIEQESYADTNFADDHRTAVEAVQRVLQEQLPPAPRRSSRLASHRNTSPAEMHGVGASTIEDSGARRGHGRDRWVPGLRWWRPDLPDESERLAVFTERYEWLEEVSEREVPPGTLLLNCFYAAIAFHQSTMSGQVWQAPAMTDQAPFEFVLNYATSSHDDSVAGPKLREFVRVDGGYGAIVDAFRPAPVGAHGFVVVRVPGRNAHVVNVTRDSGGVLFVDGQAGRAASLPPGPVDLLFVAVGALDVNVPGHRIPARELALLDVGAAGKEIEVRNTVVESAPPAPFTEPEIAEPESRAGVKRKPIDVRLFWLVRLFDELRDGLLVRAALSGAQREAVSRGDRISGLERLTAAISGDMSLAAGDLRFADPKSANPEQILGDYLTELRDKGVLFGRPQVVSVPSFDKVRDMVTVGWSGSPKGLLIVDTDETPFRNVFVVVNANQRGSDVVFLDPLSGGEANLDDAGGQLRFVGTGDASPEVVGEPSLVNLGALAAGGSHALRRLVPGSGAPGHDKDLRSALDWWRQDKTRASKQLENLFLYARFIDKNDQSDDRLLSASARAKIVIAFHAASAARGVIGPSRGDKVALFKAQLDELLPRLKRWSLDVDMLFWRADSRRSNLTDLSADEIREENVRLQWLKADVDGASGLIASLKRGFDLDGERGDAAAGSTAGGGSGAGGSVGGAGSQTTPDVQRGEDQHVEETLRRSMLPASLSLASSASQRPFGLEFEFVFEDGLSEQQKKQRLQRIVDELRGFGLTTQHEVGGEHSRRGSEEGYLSRRDSWTVELDGSVDGEIVSPILPYADAAESERMWPDVAVVLAVIHRHGGRSNEKVGGHVHVAVGDYARDPGKFVALVNLFRAHQDSLYRLAALPDKRFHRGYFHTEPVRSLRPRPGPETENLANQMRWWDEEGGIERRRALNLNPVYDAILDDNPPDNDHVEFRLWDGDLSIGGVQARVDLSRVLADTAARSSGITGLASSELGEAFIGGDSDRRSDAEALQAILDLFPSDAEDSRERLTKLWRHTRWQPPWPRLLTPAGQVLWIAKAPEHEWEGLDSVAARHPDLQAIMYANNLGIDADAGSDALAAKRLEYALERWTGTRPDSKTAAKRSLVVAVEEASSRTAELDLILAPFGTWLVRPATPQDGNPGRVVPWPNGEAVGWSSSTGWLLIRPEPPATTSPQQLGQFFGPDQLDQVLKQLADQTRTRPDQSRDSSSRGADQATPPAIPPILGQPPALPATAGPTTSSQVGDATDNHPRVMMVNTDEAMINGLNRAIEKRIEQLADTGWDPNPDSLLARLREQLATYTSRATGQVSRPLPPADFGDGPHHPHASSLTSKVEAVLSELGAAARRPAPNGRSANEPVTVPELVGQAITFVGSIAAGAPAAGERTGVNEPVYDAIIRRFVATVKPAPGEPPMDTSDFVTHVQADKIDAVSTPQSWPEVAALLEMTGIHGILFETSQAGIAVMVATPAHRDGDGTTGMRVWRIEQTAEEVHSTTWLAHDDPGRELPTGVIAFNKCAELVTLESR
jgi:hypothetical protein